MTGHGIPKELLDDILKVTRDFFYLKPEEKLKYSNVIDGDKFQHEGYGIDRVDTTEQILDWCDRLYLKVKPHDERRLELWPSYPPSFRVHLREYTEECEQVGTWLFFPLKRYPIADEKFKHLIYIFKKVVILN